jgi:hypothetical protein
MELRMQDFLAKKSARVSSFIREQKSILNVLDAHLFGFKNHPNHVEPKGIAGLVKARNPDFGRAAQLALFSPVDCAQWAAEICRRTGFHLDERDNPTIAVACRPRGDDVDVAMAITEASIGYVPAMDMQPPLGHPLSAESHRLPGHRHLPEPKGVPGDADILEARSKSFHSADAVSFG